MIERNIDYLSFSALFSEQACKDKKMLTCATPKFYQTGYLDSKGIRYFFGNPKTNKCLVQMSGECLQSLRNDQKLDAEILNWALEYGKVSRLDLAVTCWQTMDGMIFVEDVEQWLKNGLISSPLLKGSSKLISHLYVKENPLKETLYIGDIKKRGKKGIFRAYDKGIDLDMGAYLSTRLELELKGDKAHNNAKRIAESNDIAGNFRASFNVKHRDFEWLMDADAVTIQRGEAKEKRTESQEDKDKWTWLMKQVAPALKKAIEKELHEGRGTVKAYYFLKEAGIDAKMFLQAPKNRR